MSDLSKLRRRVRDALANVEKKQEKLDNAKRGKITAARKDLTKAKTKLKEAEKAYKAEVDRRDREQAKKDEKARKLREKAEKAREELRRHIEEDAKARRREREEYERERERELDRIALEKKAAEEKARQEAEAAAAQAELDRIAREEAERKRIEDLFQDDEGKEQVGRQQITDWLVKHGWGVVVFSSGDFDASVTQEWEPGSLSELANLETVAGVWWRAEISVIFDRYPDIDELEAYEGQAEAKKEGSLTREGMPTNGLYEFSVTKGTGWHADPWRLDDTIDKVIKNIESKHGKARSFRVTLQAKGRTERPKR